MRTAGAEKNSFQNSFAYVLQVVISLALAFLIWPIVAVLVNQVFDLYSCLERGWLEYWCQRPLWDPPVPQSLRKDLWYLTEFPKLSYTLLASTVIAHGLRSFTIPLIRYPHSFKKRWLALLLSFVVAILLFLFAIVVYGII